MVRLDAKDKLNGKLCYIEDMQFDNMHYARTLRSTIAHGKVVAIHYPPIEEGITVVDANDVLAANEVAMILKDMPLFANDQVTYLGEPMALIIGKDKDQVVAYLNKIHVDYEEHEAVYTLEASLLNPENTMTDHHFSRGDLTTLDYDDVFEKTYETGYQEQLYMEKQGVVGTYESGVITVYGSLQCPYYVLNALKHATGLDEKQVRVIQSPTGGAFGGKEEYPSLLACQVAVATKKVGHPVQLIFDRREDMAYTTKRHPSKTHMKTYLKNKKIVGMTCDILLDAGSYLGLSDVVLQRAILTMMGAYMFDYLSVRGRCQYTNNVFTGAFRGFGAPQSMYALEHHMNQLSRYLGCDPIALRRAYFVKQGDATSTSGTFNEAIYLNELTDMLLDLSDYKTRRAKQKPYEGYGLAIIPHGGGFTGDGEATHIMAVVKLRKEIDDQVTILVANVEMGQGAITALSKIVASVLDIPLTQVHYHIPDTFHVPDSGPTVASRTTMVVGGLLFKAAKQVLPLMGQPVVFTAEEHFKQPSYVKWNQETLQGNAYMAYSWSAVLARVEVDPTTYEVTCTDIWGSYDVGIPIDDKLLTGQIHGGVIQGLGYALLEKMTSTKGKIDHISFASYPIPTTMDVPNMHSNWLINRFGDGPFGAKSVGELTLVAVAPAVASAIEDAIGASINHIPVTPEDIMEVLK